MKYKDWKSEPSKTWCSLTHETCMCLHIVGHSTDHSRVRGPEAHKSLNKCRWRTNMYICGSYIREPIFSTLTYKRDLQIVCQPTDRRLPPWVSGSKLLKSFLVFHCDLFLALKFFQVFYFLVLVLTKILQVRWPPVSFNLPPQKENRSPYNLPCAWSMRIWMWSMFHLQPWPSSILHALHGIKPRRWFPM